MADETALVELHFVEESGKDIAKEVLEKIEAKDVHVYEGFAEGVVGRGELDALSKDAEGRGLILNVTAPLSPEVELASSGEQMERLFPGSMIKDDHIRQCVADFQRLSRKVSLEAIPQSPMVRHLIRRSPWFLIPLARFLAKRPVYHVSDTARFAVDSVLDGIDIEGLMGSIIRNRPDHSEMLPKDAYLVRLRAGLRPEWARQIREAGGGTRVQQAPFTYIMQLTPDQVAKIEALPFVLGTKRYGLVNKLSEDFQEALVKQQESKNVPAARAAFPTAALSDTSDIPDTFDVLLHSEDDLNDVVDTLKAAPGMEVVERARDQIRVKSALDNPVLSALANNPKVMKITPYAQPKLACDNVRAHIGSNAVATAGATKWDGSGQVVAVIDSGIDDAHPDLSTQLASPPLSFRSGTAMDTHGHGTHVAGIVAGSGTASGGQFAGVAPGSRLVSIGIVDASASLNLPLDMGELLQIGYDKNARIFNLSLGAGKSGVPYEGGALSVDRFVWEHPDALIVVAAGNSGSAKCGGKHDLESINSPGNAKNVLTVGSACSARQANPPQTWGQRQGQDFPALPAAAELVSGDTAIPAGDSSRGPTDYLSVKPDVLAPGTMIVSARSSASAKPGFNGNTSYLVLSGTSMAAPAVSGAATILRQFLQNQPGIGNPSAALLKALLIASAQPLGYSHPLKTAFEPDFGFPDFHQGFGCIDLRRILPNPARPAGCIVSFVDVPAGSKQALSSMQLSADASDSHPVQRFQFSTSNVQAPLRVVLTWTDPPGKGPQHNLNLSMQAGSSVRVGNDRHTFSPHPLSKLDVVNTVEMIQIDDPSASAKYTVKVQAQSSYDGGQGYALVVIGPIGKGLKQSWTNAVALEAGADTF